MTVPGCDVAIIGAGSVGVAVAYYLATHRNMSRIVLIDAGDPMALTSAQSGENYRNWWPHPVMTAFTDHSIDLMEEIARASDNRIHMTRRGYALATRESDPAKLIEALNCGYGEGAVSIRLNGAYAPANSDDWRSAQDGVDILTDRTLLRRHFPSFAPDVASIVHIRRAGDISAQQLGQFMLERIREQGGCLQRGRVIAIESDAGFTLTIQGADDTTQLRADRLVNAAGPFAADIAAMLGEDLPVATIFQQKVALEDRAAAVPRSMPFAIDLDPQTLTWTEEEHAILAADPATAALLAPMPGGVHCRPDGATWIKLGWAINRTPSDPAADPPLDPNFPDLVLRAASRLNPSLGVYLGRLPRGARHYGGYYTMTAENWPLIGPMRTQGAFAAAALSGYGTMGACAAGAICAAWIAGTSVPTYAHPLSAARHADAALMRGLLAADRGVL